MDEQTNPPLLTFFATKYSSTLKKQNSPKIRNSPTFPGRATAPSPPASPKKTDSRIGRKDAGRLLNTLTNVCVQTGSTTSSRPPGLWPWRARCGAASSRGWRASRGSGRGRGTARPDIAPSLCPKVRKPPPLCCACNGVLCRAGAPSRERVPRGHRRRDVGGRSPCGTQFRCLNGGNDVGGLGCRIASG